MSDSLPESDVDIAFESRYAFLVRTYPVAVEGIEDSWKACRQDEKIESGNGRR
jgi:hypothetical protein